MRHCGFIFYLQTSEITCVSVFRGVESKRYTAVFSLHYGATCLGDALQSSCYETIFLFRNHCHAALDLFTDPRASHRVPLRRFVVITRVRFTMQRSFTQCGIDFRDLLHDPSRSWILLTNAQSIFDCATKNTFILCSSSR